MSASINREYDRYFIRKFVSAWALPKLRLGMSVLDAGSGNRSEQMFRQNILDTGAELTTCDAKENDGVDLVVDLHSLPLPDAKFDLLLCIQVLEHVRHPDKACAEFFRVLKPGGIAIITVPQITHTLTDGTPPHFFNFTRHGIEACLVSAGFKIIAIEAQGGHFCVLGNLLHYSVKVLGDSPLPKWLKPPLILFCRVSFGLIGKAFFRIIDRLDTNQRSSLGWNVCAEKCIH
jgi:SAM-dependent methyltransferase